MRCREVVQRLIDYYYSELADEERALVQRHLKECATCGSEFDAVKEALDAIPRDAEERLPEGLTHRIQAAVRKEAQRPSTRLTGFSPARWMPAMASVVFVLFVGVLTFNLLPTQKTWNGEKVTEEELEMVESLELLENLELLEILELLEEILETPQTDQKGGDLL